MQNNYLERAHQALASGMQLPQCQKCGCMHQTLEMVRSGLPYLDTSAAKILRADLATWMQRMKPVRYGCLGCEYCYPAIAQNLLNATFPHLESAGLSCNFQVNDASWPAVTGEYLVLNSRAPVAVSTLASTGMVDELARLRPEGLAIAGKTETENIGIDKIIKNMITNPALRYLIVCGVDSQGHQTGQTLLALARHGVDANRRVIGSPGKRPVLRNVSLAEIKHFREQVQVLDKIGCQSPDEIAAQIQELVAKPAAAVCGCDSRDTTAFLAGISSVEKTYVTETDCAVTLDKAGYFVILPLAGKKLITVEYYDYDNTLRHIVEGHSARAIYLALIERGWVTKLSHAAYLGKELARAELALTHGIKYVQEGA